MEEYLKYTMRGYDFIYLDGSDCPDEMLKQFNDIDRSKTAILCDDFSQKGVHLLEQDGLLFQMECSKDFGEENIIEENFMLVHDLRRYGKKRLINHERNG